MKDLAKAACVSLAFVAASVILITFTFTVLAAAIKFVGIPLVQWLITP